MTPNLIATTVNEVTGSFQADDVIGTTDLWLTGLRLTIRGDYLGNK